MATRTTPGTTAALTIAGSDPSGGAGIQADLKTFAAMEVFGCAAITAITAQNTTGVHHSHPLDPHLVEQQIDAVASDIAVHATKIGMLANAAVAALVVKTLKRLKLAPLVVDPVITATTGQRLTDDPAVQILCNELLPLATIVTPNAQEAACLLGQTEPISDIFTASDAAGQICARFGVKTCIVTGIERKSDQTTEAVDLFFDGQDVHEIASEWRPTTNLHGSGCTFSAAITGALALGQPLDQAVQTAKIVVSEAIRQTTGLGQGACPVNHLAYLKIK